jgi:hypothetical protein
VQRRALAAGAILLGAACVRVSEPTNFTFRYKVAAYGCSASCDTPGDSAITSAARGDTVWVSHLIELLTAHDAVTPQIARLRPDCAENVVLLVVGGTAGSLPAPTTCPDSTYRMSFTLQGSPYPSSLSRDTRWIIDSALTPGTYGVRGRVLVSPRLEPMLAFAVQ